MDLRTLLNEAVLPGRRTRDDDNALMTWPKDEAVLPLRRTRDAVKLLGSFRIRAVALSVAGGTTSPCSAPSTDTTHACIIGSTPYDASGRVVHVGSVLAIRRGNEF